MPFIQPTQSRTITDYRSSCRVNSEAKTDADTKTDGAYRHYLQNNAVESRDARVATCSSAAVLQDWDSSR